jgi:hypothetical protein
MEENHLGGAGGAIAAVEVVYAATANARAVFFRARYSVARPSQ